MRPYPENYSVGKGGDSTNCSPHANILCQMFVNLPNQIIGVSALDVR